MYGFVGIKKASSLLSVVIRYRIVCFQFSIFFHKKITVWSMCKPLAKYITQVFREKCNTWEHGVFGQVVFHTFKRLLVRPGRNKK